MVRSIFLAKVTFFGNNTSISVAIVVADAFAVSGNPTVNLQGSAGLSPGVSIITNAISVDIRAIDEGSKIETAVTTRQSLIEVAFAHPIAVIPRGWND